jgi:phage/plasmid-associated DNA primase
VAEVVPELHVIRSLPVPDDQQEYKETLERSLNPIGAFISDELEFVPGGHVTRDGMAERYDIWCKDNGRQPLSRDKLIQVLKDNLENKSVQYTRRRLPSDIFGDKDNRTYMFLGIKFVDHEAEEDLL